MSKNLKNFIPKKHSDLSLKIHATQNANIKYEMACLSQFKVACCIIRMFVLSAYEKFAYSLVNMLKVCIIQTIFYNLLFLIFNDNYSFMLLQNNFPFFLEKCNNIH